MSIHPAMPTITFSDGADLDALFTVLHLANKGLGLGKGEGLTYQFALAGGLYYVGTYMGSDGDSIKVALHQNGSPTGAYVTVEATSLVTVTYL